MTESYGIRPVIMIKKVSENKVSDSKKVIKSYEDYISDDVLCAASLKCYEAKYDKAPPYVRIDNENDNLVTIQLYDITLEHTNTWEWFTIDRRTSKGSSMFSGNINLIPYF